MTLEPKSVAAFYRRVHGSAPRRWASRCSIWTMPHGARRPDPASSRTRSHASYDREPASSASGACCVQVDRGAQGIPRPLHRQGEPGAFLLGQLRSRASHASPAGARPPHAASADRSRAKATPTRSAASAGGRAMPRVRRIRLSTPTPRPSRRLRQGTRAARQRPSTTHDLSQRRLTSADVRAAASPRAGPARFLPKHHGRPRRSPDGNRRALERDARRLLGGAVSLREEFNPGALG